ncbi:ATP-binding protein [Pseudoxanthomonas putridarboris]|uniref:Winged helix-turn-helix domain-containing protein n=1 Tax=Pseudoxanthomonas putridarboris TaxID=752605 RepID=A0ABU9IZT1_9GAMM
MVDYSSESAARAFSFGPFVLVPSKQLLLRDGIPIRIGGRALDLLTALVERQGELVTKRELVARVWPKTIVEEGNLKVNMTALRRVLGEGPGGFQYIATVFGRGYKFVATVESAIDPGDERAPHVVCGHHLPPVVQHVVGRSSDIATIRRELTRTRLVSIVGSGGIGKTTVAIAAARESAEHAVFIDLSTIGDSQFVPLAIASALGLNLSGSDPLATAIHAMRSQEKLLVFDNCEHLLSATASAVDRLMRGIDGLRILVTSREPLRMRNEHVYRLTGLECDPASDSSASDALKFAAIELFATRAYERANYELTDGHAPAVAEICRRLDGNALAIELAATQAAAFDPEQILRMLDDWLRLLRLEASDAPPRHQSLRATLDWSYSLLSDREARLLRCVSMFAGVFSTDAAAALSGYAPSDTLDLLAQLSAKSLVAVDVSAEEIIFRVLDATRNYGIERLRYFGEEEDLRLRHAEYVCRVLELAEEEWPQRPAGEWGDAYFRTLDDLRAALAWARRDPANGPMRIRLTVAGLLLWNHFSLTEECRSHVSQAVDEINAVGLAGTQAEMRLQAWLGGATMFTCGLMPQAVAAMKRALEIAERLGNTDYRVRCLRLIGVYELFSGENEAAIATLEQFSSLAAEEMPSASLEAEVALGIGHLFVGRLREVRERFEARHDNDLLEINDVQRVRYHVRYLSDRIVDVTNLLSHAQWLTGSPDAAIATAMSTVEYAQRTKHNLSLSNALSWVCPVFFLAGRSEDCERHVSMLDEQVRRNGFVVRRPVVSFYRHALACASDSISIDAVRGLDQALSEFRATGHLARMPFYLSVYAEALARSGLLNEARVAIKAALDRARAKNDLWCMPEILRIKASILRLEGHAEDAGAFLKTSLDMAREMGALSWMLRTAIDLARLWQVGSRTEEAHAVLSATFGMFREGFLTHDLMMASDLLASLGKRKS